MKNQNKIKKIMEHFGINNQQRKLQEEIFELQEAITSEQVDDYANYTITNVLEELGDVRNVLDCIQYYYDISEKELNKVRNKKLDRTLERIKTGYYNKKEE